MPDDRRRRELAKIHLAKKALGLNDTTYREMLMEVAGVKSAKDLDWKGRAKVLGHLERCGWKGGNSHRQKTGGGKQAYPGRPKNMDGQESKSALLRKIEALLADMKLPWSYADGISKRMFKVEKIPWCTGEQLYKIVAALAYRQKKHGGGS